MNIDYATFEQFISQFGWPGLLYVTVCFAGHKVWVWWTQTYWPQLRQDKERWYTQVDKLAASVETMAKELVELRKENRTILDVVTKSQGDHYAK